MLSRRTVDMTITVILFWVGGTSWGTAYYVDPNGSDDANGLSWATAFATIGKSITTGGNGDTVDVNEGTYYESINFSGKSILEGVTVAGGRYGIYCYSSSSPSIAKCTISNNSSYGVRIANGSSTFSRCTISDNDSFGIYGYGNITVENCIVANNSSFGIRVSSSSGNFRIINCTFVGNTSYGVYGYADETKNCVIWDNGDDLSLCSATYRCIEDQNEGTGSIHSDPMLIDAEKIS